MTTYSKPSVAPAWGEGVVGNTANMIQPTDSEVQAGWPLSSTPPSRQRFNWILNWVANGMRYFMQRGLPDYDAAETYGLNARVIGDDGKTYRSVVANNIGNTPSSNSGAQWERWGWTKSELDTYINGANASFIVRVASTTSINLSSPGSTIDGITMVAGDRFLEKDNSVGGNRGVYVWNGAATAATRALDLDTGVELKPGILIEVTEGSTQADTLWTLATDAPVTIGTTALAFSKKDGSGLVSQNNTWTKAQRGAFATLTSSGGSIAVDFSAANNYQHTLTENTTLATPSNAVAGQSGEIFLTQNATAAKALAVSVFWKFPGGIVPALTTTLSAVDVLVYTVDPGGASATCQMIKDRR